MRKRLEDGDSQSLLAGLAVTWLVGSQARIKKFPKGSGKDKTVSYHSPTHGVSSTVGFHIVILLRVCWGTVRGNTPVFLTQNLTLISENTCKPMGVVRVPFAPGHQGQFSNELTNVSR